MMKQITITLAAIAALALAACGTDKATSDPKLTIAVMHHGELADGEDNPIDDVEICIDGYKIKNNENRTEEPVHVCKATDAEGKASFNKDDDLSAGSWDVSFVISAEGWELDSGTFSSVTIGEMSDISRTAYLKRSGGDNSDLEQAIADFRQAWEDWMNGVATEDDVNAARDALLAVLADLGLKLDDLMEDVRDAMRASMGLVGTIEFTCADPQENPIEGCVLIETNVDWAAMGENVKTCTTDASGVCRVDFLLLDVPLRFSAEASGFLSEYNVWVTLESAMVLKRTVMLQASAGEGALVWQNFAVDEGQIRDISGTLFVEDADGNLSLAEDAKCTITDGINNISVTLDCATLEGLQIGCGEIRAFMDDNDNDAFDDGESSVLSIVRVKGDGAPESCPEP